MNSKENIEERLAILRKSIFTEDAGDVSAVLLSTSKEKPNIYSIDDAIFRWIYGVLLLDSYTIITQEKIITLYKEASAADKLISLRTPDKIILDQIKGSVADQIKSYANGRLFASDVACANSDISALSLVDKTYDLEGVLIVHLENELARIRNAGRVADGALTKVFKLQMEQAIENQEPTPLKELSNYTRKDLNNPAKINPKLNPSDVEPAFRPAIKCGNVFDIDFPPEIGAGNLTYDFVNATIGINFKSYVAIVGRTYIINGTPTVKKAYKSLVKAKEAALLQCKPGNTLGSVYRAFINGLDEEYRQFAPKSIGGFSGTNVITTKHVITDESEEKIPANCSIVLAIGLKEVRVEEHPPFTFSLVDTIQVTEGEEGVAPVTKAKDRYKQISYKYDNEDKDQIMQELINDPTPMYERTRNKKSGGKKDEEDPELASIFAQFENAKNVTRQTALSKKSTDDDEEHPISFNSVNEITGAFNPNNIFVVKPASSVLLPLYGQLIPFHINVIKSVTATTSSDGTVSTIVFAFNIPKASDTDNFKYFIKELTFTSHRGHFFDGTAKEIKQMMTNYKKFLKSKQDEKSVFKGEDLQMLHNKSGKPIPRLPAHVHIRPAISGSTKTAGTFEAHINGFRFRSLQNERLDIMYQNIELAVFQPATQDNEMMTLIHFYLKQPIKINSKLEHHVTIYKPTGDASTDISKTSNSMTDQAEAAEDERDIKIRKKANKEFKTFIKSLDDPELGLRDPPDFQVPAKPLGFKGVATRQISTIYPLKNALISVIDSPPFVLMTDRVDVVVFERETYSVTNIDITFLLKDMNEDPVQISNVSVSDVKNIKKWLEVLKIKYYSQRNNIRWNDVLPKFRKMKREVFENDVGGWDGFFAPEEEEDVNSENEDKTWKDDDDDFDAGEEDDEEFDAVPDEDEDEGPVDDEDDDGKDWRQLDEEAEAADLRAKEKRERKKHHHHHHHH